MPAWPSTLPAPLAESYELRPVDPVVRTQMDAGNTRSRRRFRSAPTRIPVAWRFSRTQMSVFETWHKLQALDGEAWFDVNLVNGLEVSSYSARFAGIWKAKLLSGLRWEVSAELEIRARPTLSADELEVAMAYAADDLTQGAALLHQRLHVDMPAWYSNFDHGN